AVNRAPRFFCRIRSGRREGCTKWTRIFFNCGLAEKGGRDNGAIRIGTSYHGKIQKKQEWQEGRDSDLFRQAIREQDLDRRVAGQHGKHQSLPAARYQEST